MNNRIISCIFAALALLWRPAASQAYLVVMAKNVRVFEAKQQEKLVYHNNESQAFLIRLNNTGYGSGGDCRRFEVAGDCGDFRLAPAEGAPVSTRQFFFSENIMCMHGRTGTTRSCLLSEDFRSINLTAKTGKLKDGQVVVLESDLTACADTGGTGRKLVMWQHWEVKEDNEFDGTRAGVYHSPAFSLDDMQPGILFIGDIPEKKILKLWEPTPYPCLFRKK